MRTDLPRSSAGLGRTAVHFSAGAHQPRVFRRRLDAPDRPDQPALHLGADRLLVISVAASGATEGASPRVASETAFARPDRGPRAEQHLSRISTIGLLNAAAGGVAHLVLKHVDCIMAEPSEPVEQIAVRHLRALPRTVRFFPRGIGAMRRSGSNLASYVLFERPFCRALMQLGYRDAMARRDEIAVFLSLPAAPAGASLRNANARSRFSRRSRRPLRAPTRLAVPPLQSRPCACRD